MLAEVSQFVELARSGAYIAGDRRVSRTERTKWRVTFRQLATDAQLALHAEDTAPGERAMELMIDLARHAEGSFRSEDPLEAAKFVLSHAVSALGNACRTRGALRVRRGRICRGAGLDGKLVFPAVAEVVLVTG
ncbi:MAG TPA: hypothetical protein VMV07_20010 [Streptosporangiaceae bacterium]|nr:hypothetical protein [Streptosporangiaceae bacterium]